MEQTEFRIDYKWEEEPLLVLPICIGAMLLYGEIFNWLRSLEAQSGGEVQLTFFSLIYWGFLVCCSALAVWRLIRTIHVSEKGLEYRFLRRTRRIIPWEEFSCASKGRSYHYRRDLIYLIPTSLGDFPKDHRAQYKFRTRHYWKLIHFHPTENNIRAIGTFIKLYR